MKSEFANFSVIYAYGPGIYKIESLVEIKILVKNASNNQKQNTRILERTASMRNPQVPPLVSFTLYVDIPRLVDTFLSSPKMECIYINYKNLGNLDREQFLKFLAWVSLSDKAYSQKHQIFKCPYTNTI